MTQTAEELKHARVTTRTPRADDPTITDIKTESYYEELNSVEEEIRKSIQTEMASLANDVIGCLRDVTSGNSLGLTIEIVVNKHTRQPERIIKTNVTRKEYYGR